MLASVWRRIGPPSFADEDQNRVARALFVLQLSLIAAALIVAGVTLLADDVRTGISLLVGCGLIAITIGLNRRGHTRSASLMVVLVMLALATFLLLQGQGVHDIAVTLYPVIIIIASLLLTRRAFLVMMAVMLVSVGAVILAEMSGWLHPVVPPLATGVDFVILSIILILAAITVRYLADSLISNLQRAQRNERALEISHAQLQHEAARLEILVEIDRAILNAQTLDSIALAVLKRLRLLIPARYAALLLFDFPHKRHEVFMIKTDHGVEILREWQPPEYFEIMEPLRRGQSHVVSDLLALPQRTPLEEQMRSEGTRSYVDAPLLAQGELIGALSFEAVEPGAYDPDRVMVIQHVADHLAIAISAARVFEAEQKQAALMTALHDVALNVNAHLDLPALLQTIVVQAAQLIQAEMGSLFLLQPDNRTLMEVCRYRLPDSDTFTQMQLGEGLSGLVALTGEALAIDDYQLWPLRHTRAEEVPYRSALAAPIKWNNRALGTITILDTRPGRFSIDDVKAVDALAAQAAVAVENARLYAEAQDRAAQLTMMNEIGQAVSALQDLNSVLELIYRQVQKVAPVDAFYIALYDPINKLVSFPIMYDQGIRYDEPPGPLKQDSRLSQVIHTGIPSRLHRTLEELQQVQERGLGNVQQRSASLLLVPLRAAEQVSGALSIQSYALNAYTDEHVSILTGIAHQAAIAIENARLYSAVQQELAERQQIEAQLREREERYRLISEVISDYTFSSALDAQGVLRLNWVAGAFEKITGYTFDEYVARGGWLATLYPDDVAQDARDMAALRANETVVTEVRVITKHDAVRWVRVYAHPVWDEQARQLVGIYGAVQDVTERRQAEAEREALIQELETRNAELERFTYTVSHDLKSPLITIRGFLGFLEKDALAGNHDRLRADIRRISDATEKMRRLLDELLELSRIGRLMNPPQAVPLAEIAQEAITLTQGRLQARGIRIDLCPPLPVVYGDRLRLVEVLQNLIDNACKFMGDQPQPQITIGCYGTDRDGKPLIFVRDNGLGIDPQYQEKVFGLFDKLDPTTEGTGIGLTLVKRIVEVHGGRLWVESAGAQRGSTFIFSLPEPPADYRQE